MTSVPAGSVGVDWDGSRESATSTNRDDTSGREQDVADARRRAGLAAAAAGLGLVPWFLIIDPVAPAGAWPPSWHHVGGGRHGSLLGAEDVRLWPVLGFDMTSGTLRDNLDPALAQAALLSRDGLNAPASVFRLWGSCGRGAPARGPAALANPCPVLRPVARPLDDR